MQEQKLNRLQQIELDMLRQFIEICDKYNLQYFVLGGTCLGAVRHNGFIPWDDDIDVGMPRKDYEKFLLIAQKELPENIFLQTYQTDPEYPMNFAKLRDSNTTFIEKSIRNLKVNHGIYIDIFPLDGFHKNRILKFKKKLYAKRIGQVFSIKREKRFLTDLKNIIVYIICPNLKQTILKQDKIFQKYDYEISNLIINHCGAWGEKEIIPKTYFGIGIKGKFEDVEVVLPERFHAYLTNLYGDYMTPPPKDKQRGHHYYTVIDTEKSYKEYI